MPTRRLLQAYIRKQREAIRLRLIVVQLLVRCIPYGVMGNLRSSLYRALGFQIEPKVYILGSLDVRGTGNILRNLAIGHGSVINTPCLLELSAPVRIGQRVGIGHNVLITTGSHESDCEYQRAGAFTSREVSIGDGAWLGAGVVVLGGVAIVLGAVAAA